MNFLIKNRQHLLVTLSIIITVSLGIFSILASGGGGGGEDDIQDDSPPPLALKVEYFAGAHQMETSALQLLFEDGSSAMLQFYLQGSYQKATSKYSLYPRNFPQVLVSSSNSNFTVVSDSFSIRSEDPLHWQYNQDHISGSLVISAIDNNIRLTAIPSLDQLQPAEVKIEVVEFDGTVTTSLQLPWSEFKAILSDTEPYEPYQVQASYAYFLMQTLYRHVHAGIDAIEFINTHQDELKSAGSGTGMTLTCDPFNYDGSQGDYHFTWTDGPGETAGQLGPGDNFSVSFNSCWKDESESTTGSYFKLGSIDFIGFWEDINGAFLGFNNVVVNSLVSNKTEEDSEGIDTPQQSINAQSLTSNNITGFHLILTPDTSTLINMANIISLADSTASALTVPQEVGAFSLDMLIEVAEGGDPDDLCKGGGSAVYSLTPDTLPIESGHIFTVTFDNCIDNSIPTDPVTFHGSYSTSLTSLFGALSSSGDYFAVILVDNLDFDFSDEVGLSHFSGATWYTRNVTAGQSDETIVSVGNNPLLVEKNGIVLTLSDYNYSSTVASNDDFSWGETGESFVFMRSDFNDAFNMKVLEPVLGSDTLSPSGGSLKLLASDGSTLLLEIDASGIVTLSLDADGDQIIDDSLQRQWEELM